MRWPKPLAVFLLGASAVVASLHLASAQTSGAQPLLVHKKKYVMGTVFEIAAYGESQTRVSDAIDLAFAEIVRTRRCDERLQDRQCA